MKDLYLIAMVLAGTVVLVGGGTYLFGTEELPADVAPSGDTKLVVENTNHSWGEIPINGGNVRAEFMIKNEGEAPLRLFDVSTSCTCTTAQLEINGKKSPEFSMHTKSGYVTEVPPGESAKLKIEFDPAFHGPQGVGAMTRQIRMKTNDAERQELMFTMDGVVI